MNPGPSIKTCKETGAKANNQVDGTLQFLSMELHQIYIKAAAETQAPNFESLQGGERPRFPLASQPMAQK